MNIYNITLRNTRGLSKYPFTLDSDLKIDNMVFPYTYISSLIVYASDVLFPLYLYSIHTNNDVITIYIVDKNLLDVYQALLKYDKDRADIKNNRGILSGHIMYLKLLYTFFMDYITRLKVSLLNLNPYSFKISGLCISCVHYKGCIGILVDNQLCLNNVTLYLLNNIVLDSDSFRLDTFGNYDKVSFLSPKLRYINNIDMRDCSVFIKPAALGDLRVITKKNGLTLTGVLDA